MAPNEGGLTVNVNGIEVHDGWVVHYNPVLLYAFNAHINVEICNSVNYINKGSDEVAFGLHNKTDN